MELTLNVQSGPGISRRLYGELRRAVLETRLQPGDKLPSSRELASQLAISRNTVTEAYDRLSREGYFEARRGSGTFVAKSGAEIAISTSIEVRTAPALSRWARHLPQSRSIVPMREMAHDFRPGLPDLA